MWWFETFQKMSKMLRN